ncbi:MAG: Nif3-like dinuclear metal center hexameric protein [Bacteroidales bacterium]|nr:Nif3-like dinuclear metal center hexameric protein [Bacteroidales bacterium]
MQICEVLSFLENKYPLDYQEDFDNCGIQCGDKHRELTGILVCFEMSDETIEEAIRLHANLVISHHPLVLKKGIQKIEPTNRVGRIICKALENKMVLYSMHTNMDNAPGGVNDAFAEKLHLQSVQVLSPMDAKLRKIVFFVPQSHKETVQEALFQAGCGTLGHYRHCAYAVDGHGCFLPDEEANPYCGTPGKLEEVEEERVEMVFPSGKQHKVIDALYQSHPYEEPAFDILKLENPSRTVGLGRVGNLPEAVPASDFLQSLKKIFGVTALRYYGDLSHPVRRVALCGGSGSSFIPAALSAGADVYVTGDVKYHDFHTADRKMLIADIGHLESEQFVKEIIFHDLKENFSTFAVSLANVERMQIEIL